MVKIFLDAGHGGKDVGATANNMFEKVFNLDIVKRIASMLSDYDKVEIKLSRDNDTFFTLTERTNKANAWGADLFVSVHCDAAESTAANGFTTFTFTNGSAKSKSIQNLMHRAIARETAGLMEDRGQKEANFHVLRESKMPAILTENGFITNSKDAAKLRDPKFIERIARAHVEGIGAFFGLALRPDRTVMKDITGHWAEKAIRYMIESGLMTGYQDNTWRPDQPITRAELAAVIAKLKATL